MKKILPIFVAILPIFFFLYTYEHIGEKTANISIIYNSTALFALLLIVGFHFLVKKKDKWFYLLFSSVFIVNLGYYMLSTSTTLNEALLYNRISYLGSVFLPLSMLMVIMNVTNIKYKKIIPYILLGIAFIVFLIAASPGYSKIYYENVSIEIINGITVLNKEYGPLHCIYLYYLLSYFTTMIYVIIYSTAKKKVASNIHAIVLALAVLVNICVWFIEQIVKIDFEILSISYIISELFLLGIYLILQEKEALVFNTSKLLAAPSFNTCTSIVTESQNNIPLQNVQETTIKTFEPTEEQLEICKLFSKGLLDLTPTERSIYEYYISGKRANDVMKILGVTSNTIKFHNKNLYRKLGVSSRKQMIEIDYIIKTST